MKGLDTYLAGDRNPKARRDPVDCNCCDCRGVRRCTDGCDCSGDCTNREEY